MRGVSPTAKTAMRRLCLWSEWVPVWVTLSQHRNALRAWRVQSWETREAGSVGKAGLVGMGRGDPAAGHFSYVRKCLGVMGGEWVAGQAPLLILGFRAAGRAGCTALVPSATCFWQ